MLYRIFAILALALACAAAEKHVVTFDNRCGRGTPHLVSQHGKVLSTGERYVSDGPLIGAIAYLQTGNCGFNGDHCTLVETTLRNPHCPGCGSSSDISLIPPHTFSVTAGFGYYHGCDGKGAECDNPHCKTAFHVPSDNQVQVACQVDNVDLVITFCKKEHLLVNY